MKKIIAILLTIILLACNILPLAHLIHEEILWQEYLEWEANDPYALLWGVSMELNQETILQALINPDSVEPEVLTAVREAFILCSQTNTIEVD